MPAGSAERSGQGEGSNKGEQPQPEVLRPANMGEDEEQCNDERYVEDTPPDWGDNHEDLNMAETQGSDQQSSGGGSRLAGHPMAVGARGETFRHRKKSRSARRKARRTCEGAIQSTSSTNGGAASCTTGASRHTAAEPTLARGPVFETTCVADKGTISK